MKIRETTEKVERETLSSRAMLSQNSRGRENDEPQCDLRTVFQRDRDRIIHSKAFRRLKHKTQVFLAPESDHYRTRLTHTLEVSQIARTIARSLRLNEDLTEAIALGHDLGHTPFGHAGERALDKISSGGFTHFEQSVRVCRYLERDGKGLNLTHEVLDGIIRHTRGEQPQTLEGQIVRIADKIAYINHDIDDAIRAGIIKADDLPQTALGALGSSTSARINSMVTAVINSSSDCIKMDAKTEKHFEELHDFLFSAVYTNPKAKGEESKVEDVLKALYAHFIMHPEKLSAECLLVLEREGIERAVLDHISGMTDHYAITAFSDICIPKCWEV